jgi:OmpA-OmpF porin, OOP family
MKNFLFTGCFTLCLLLGFGSFSPADAQQVLEPKAENFVYYVDNSGSMGFQYEALGTKKSVAARDLLVTINNEVPELDADFGVYTYAPYKEFQPVSGFNRQGIEDAFNAIPVDFEIFGRQTPMGTGFESLDVPVSRLQDRTAVIVVTDGESNLGPDPKGVMQDMYNRYGDRICFHFISFAQSEAEKTAVDEWAGLNPCSVVAGAADLAGDNVRADFIQKVFYDTREVVVAPAPEPRIEPRPEPRIEPRPVPVEEVIVFNNINFDFDRTEIKSEFRENLREAVRIIRDRPAKNVIVEGHTCNIGPAEYNMGLSQRRAQSVADFLIQEGVSKDRIKIKGYGLTNSKFNNNTREGRALNRRVEINLN